MAAWKHLISPRDLALQRDTTWRVFDCRHDLVQPDFGRRAYALGHIPGALHVHLDDDLSGPCDGRNGRHPLPDPHVFAHRLGNWGVGDGNQVVCYDDAGGIYAARMWWMLRWIGHERVAVLDGGLQLWQREGLPLTVDVPPVEPAQHSVRLMDATVDADSVLAHLRSPDLTLIDARSPDRYRGENESLDPVAGHIPGATNRFYRCNLAFQDRFKQPDQLRAEFEQLLHDSPPSAVVHQCGSGVTACHNLLAMEIAGLRGSRLYPGSWSEWCSDPNRPVAMGSD